MNGPTVMLCVFSIVGSVAIACALWVKDRDERARRRWEVGGVSAWEQIKRDLAPRDYR